MLCILILRNLYLNYAKFRKVQYFPKKADYLIYYYIHTNAGVLVHCVTVLGRCEYLYSSVYQQCGTQVLESTNSFHIGHL